jgi:hypothetical protein
VSLVRFLFASSALSLACAFASAPAQAAPAAPSGAHPRIWLDAPTLAALKTNAAASGTAAAAVVAKCKDIAANPNKYNDGLFMGYGFGYAASACAMAWQLTKDPSFATAAIRQWHALLDDFQTIGDGAGGATTVSGQHDNGYAMRYFGTFTAVVYDWLHDAPGVDASILQTSRDRFKTWVDWEEANGYLHDVAGSNYQAGYVLGKTMISIAASGEDDGSAAKYWADVVDTMWAKENLGPKGAGAGGPLAGGDWPEGWEYGELCVLEYAASLRAVEQQGASFPAGHTYFSQLGLDYVYALTPDQKGFFIGGDYGNAAVPAPNKPPAAEPLLAVMLGGSDEAAGWAAYLHANVVKTRSDGLVYEALAEARGTTAASYTSQARPLYYVTAGTRKLYARSAFDPSAVWGVFVSAPHFAVDHQHLDASTFVFSRGADSLVVDPSPYGSLSSLTSNALTVDSQTVQGDYRPSQSPHSAAALPWARATAGGVAVARAELAHAFDDDTGKTDVPFARRDWAFLPEGEVVTIDRVRTDDAARKTYLRFRSPSPFTIGAGNVATATVGGSKLVVHPVTLSGGTPSAKTYKGDNGSPCANGTFGTCTGARFDVGEYALEVPGPQALAVHVLDALASADAPADAVASADPAVVGARVTRGGARSFVLASSAKDGAAPATFAYAATGDLAARHVVFDAPEDASGASSVTAKASGGDCAVSITAATGPGAFAGRPLVFQVAASKDGCTVTEDKPAPPPGTPGGDGGTGGRPGGPSQNADSAPPGGVTGGCSCDVPGGATSPAAALAALGAALGIAVARLRRRRR